MPPFPLLRRRRTADFMTPGINPDAELPEPAALERIPYRSPLGALTRMPDTGLEDNPAPPRPPAMPDMGAAPLPEFRPPLTRGDEYYGRKAEYLAGAPGRGKSALIGALEGLGRGEGLIGAAAGGLTGAISPRRLREQQFEQRIRPQMMERFAFEDQARAQQAAEAKAGQESALNQARIGELNRRGQPRPLPPQRPVSSPRGLYDPEAGAIIPGTEPLPTPQRPPGPHWVRDASGNYVDLNAPQAQNQPRKPVRGYDRPREGRQPKEAKKYAAISDIRDAVKQAKKNDPNMTTSRMKAIFKSKGYEIVED